MPETMDTVDVLRRVMDDHNVNQSEFALEAGVSYVTVNRWMNRRSALTEKKLVSVLTAIGIDPAAYGLDARKLPRGTTADLVGQVLEQMAAAEERARQRHEEVMAELRRVGNALDALDTLQRESSESVDQLLVMANEGRHESP